MILQVFLIAISRCPAFIIMWEATLCALAHCVIFTAIRNQTGGASPPPSTSSLPPARQHPDQEGRRVSPQLTLPLDGYDAVPNALPFQDRAQGTATYDAWALLYSLLRLIWNVGAVKAGFGPLRAV